MPRFSRPGLYPAAMTNNTIKTLSLLLLAAAGCTTETEEPTDKAFGIEIDEPAPVEDKTPGEQNLTGASMNWYSCASDECNIDVGNFASETCFIGGIKGKLSSGTSAKPIGVHVDVDGTDWNLRILHPTGENLQALVTCIPATANRAVSYFWREYLPATEIGGGPNPSKRRCFVQGIYSLSSTTFNSLSRYVNIWRDGNSHFIGGDLSSTGKATVWATCVDTNVAYNPYWYGNGSGSAVTGNVVYNPTGANKFVGCGLTGIGGQLTSTSRGWNLGYDYGTRYYTMRAAAYSAGGASCVE